MLFVILASHLLKLFFCKQQLSLARSRLLASWTQMQNSSQTDLGIVATGRAVWHCSIHGTVSECPFRWMHCSDEEFLAPIARPQYSDCADVEEFTAPQRYERSNE